QIPRYRVFLASSVAVPKPRLRRGLRRHVTGKRRVSTTTLSGQNVANAIVPIRLQADACRLLPHSVRSRLPPAAHAAQGEPEPLAAIDSPPAPRRRPRRADGRRRMPRLDLVAAALDGPAEHPLEPCVHACHVASRPVPAAARRAPAER